MDLTLYQVDAFAQNVFQGNPAAVCPLETWLDDSVMQAIAQENNLAETAFFIANKDRYDLRWFTPTTEVDFCGHATLAAAYVLFECLSYTQASIKFNTRMGEFTVSKDNNDYIMDFPRIELKPYSIDSALLATIGLNPKETLIGDDVVVVLESEQEIIEYQANYELLKSLPARGLSITAASDNYDFVSRFFGPKAGINEDPVTGSAHCALAPYWSKKLNKNSLLARQVSTRGGDVSCLVDDKRVTLSGQAVLYMTATISI